MTSPHDKAQAIRANIAADRITRGARWLCWLAIVGGLVLPMVAAAWREAGALAAAVVLALLLALSWHVKPAGKSYAARCKEIDAEHWPRE